MLGNGLFILGMASKRKDLNFLGLEINEKVLFFLFFSFLFFLAS
jgi:tRNA G46 methylase TrmB